jgi:exopolysaccharide biosynthesis polyprenyl glycosylphosphotransferase
VVKQQHQLFVALLCVSDAIVATAAAMAAWAVRRASIEGFAPNSWETYFKEPLVYFAVPLTLYAMWGFGLYRPRRDRSVWGELGQIVRASLGTVAGLVVLLWLVGNQAIGAGHYGSARVFGYSWDASRVQLGTLAVALPLFMCVHRAGFRLTLRWLRRHGWNLRHVLVIGSGRLGQIACRTIERNSWTGINVKAFLSHHDHTRRTMCGGKPVLGGLSDLDRVLEAYEYDAVYLAIPSSRASVVPHVLKRLERFSIDVRIIPDVHPRYLPQSMTVSELEGMPILSVRECPLYGLGGFTKRLVDLGGAAVLLMFIWPVLLAIAALVRISSPGPAIFKQRRVSLGGEEFDIYKFRTMYHEEDERLEGQEAAEAVRSEVSDGSQEHVEGWTRVNDARITTIGRWLRKTSLDELPQLLNVVRGEMSLVGPRPERPELITRFRDDWRGYMLRQHVKAGMTGWAQVNGLRGQSSLKKRLQYDLFYIRHWSVWFDIRILFQTLFSMHKGAH